MVSYILLNSVTVICFNVSIVVNKIHNSRRGLLGCEAV